MLLECFVAVIVVLVDGDGNDRGGVYGSCNGCNGNGGGDVYISLIVVLIFDGAVLLFLSLSSMLLSLNITTFVNITSAMISDNIVVITKRKC